VPTLIVNLAALSSGLSLGFSAIALPQLKANNDTSETNETSSSYYYQPFQVNMESGSWIASIFGLGAIFGGFAAAYLGSQFGRRKALIMMAVPDTLGWILIAAAQNAPMMLIGRFLNGFSASGYSSCIQVSLLPRTPRGALCTFARAVKTWCAFERVVGTFPTLWVLLSAMRAFAHCTWLLWRTLGTFARCKWLLRRTLGSFARCGSSVRFRVQ